ncbi:MAG TPA: hypothetical protein VME24_07450 [Alphaproteobacteria bacterium]|nr:hypothetical protein [Alphaproteobacteria bacterium]
MKNIRFAAQKTGWKILAPLALFTSFAAAGILIIPFIPEEWRILATIAVGLALFTWSVFRLIKPVGYDRNWQIAEMILVPLYSLMLTLVAAVCVVWLIQHSRQELQDTVFGIFH